MTNETQIQIMERERKAYGAFYVTLYREVQDLATRIHERKDPANFDSLIEEIGDKRFAYIKNYECFTPEEKTDLTRLLGEVRALAVDKRDILRIRDLRETMIKGARKR